MELFNRFDVHHDTTYADLLVVNALAVAARNRVAVEVEKVDDSNVTLTLPSGRQVTGSDWDNLYLALVGA